MRRSCFFFKAPVSTARIWMNIFLSSKNQNDSGVPSKKTKLIEFSVPEAFCKMDHSMQQKFLEVMQRRLNTNFPMEDSTYEKVFIEQLIEKFFDSSLDQEEIEMRISKEREFYTMADLWNKEHSATSSPASGPNL